MIVEPWKVELMANILVRGKSLAPDRFPQASPETAEAWASALGAMLSNFPVEIWPEAVDVWSMELVTDRMITPKELKEAAYVVRDRWESDGQKSELLRVARERARDERDRQLREGTFAEVRGRRRPTLPPPAHEVPDFVQDIVKKKKIRK